jgi:hypothetical protein
MRLVLLALAVAISACSTTTNADQYLGQMRPRAPLHVDSDPPGVLASVTYGDVVDHVTESCTTPCDLTVPVGAPMALSFQKPGYRPTGTPPTVVWRPHLFGGGATLVPNTLTVHFVPVPHGS